MTNYKNLKAEAEALFPQLVAWRRDFHTHPELGFQEVRTAGIVADHLHQLGLEVTTGVGQTGVVAMVEGDELPANAPTVMLRFDMDALPIHEATGLPFASQTPGVMHACGHDGHTAIGMGVAQLLTQYRNQLGGRVKLVFQPAEEVTSGARAMIADGVMEHPSPASAFGLHLWSQLPLNQVVVQAGPLWASAGRFTVTIEGKSSHGAMPHEGIDAILVASHVVVALQSIVSRNLDPIHTGVITIGQFESGTAWNIVSPKAILTGTIRSFDDSVHQLLVRRIKEIAEGICAGFGATATVEITGHVPATVNSEAGAQTMQLVAEQIVEPEQIAQISPMMVGEDMAEFLTRAPGCFILLGAADPDKPLPGAHHNPLFDFDERMMPTGVALLAGVAIKYLKDATSTD